MLVKFRGAGISSNKNTTLCNKSEHSQLATESTNQICKICYLTRQRRVFRSLVMFQIVR